MVLTVVAHSMGHAAFVSVDNLGTITGGSTPSLILLDPDGSGLTSGFFSLYGAAIIPSTGGGSGAAVSPIDLSGAIELQKMQLSGANSIGPGSFVGGFSFLNDGSLNGLNLLLVIGTGGSDLDSATYYGVIDMDLALSKADIPPPPESIPYAIESTSSILVGEFVPSVTVDWSLVGAPSFTAPGLRLVPIPEPSSILLYGLGLMGILWMRVRP